MSTPTFHGSCLCGALSFEIREQTKWCAHCHCTLCRATHGCAFVTWVGVEAQRFVWKDPESVKQHYASTPEAKRIFCGRCGTPLGFESSRWPGEVHVTRASIVGDIDRPPAAHVYFDRHVSWVELADKLLRRGGEGGMEVLED